MFFVVLALGRGLGWPGEQPLTAYALQKVIHIPIAHQQELSPEKHPAACIQP